MGKRVGHFGMSDVARLRMRAEQLRELLVESTDHKLRALLSDTADDIAREADEAAHMSDWAANEVALFWGSRLS